MRTAPLLRRIDEHLGEIRDELRLNRVERERTHRSYQEALDEMRRAYEDQLQITREVVRRNEVAFHDMRDALVGLQAESRATREELLANRDATRAHTQAIFRLLDHLDDDGKRGR